MTDGRAGVVGSWILTSCYFEVIDSGERLFPYGENPRGVLILSANGRMAAVITPRALAMSASEADRAMAFDRLVAYSGRYRLEGSRFVTDVDVSWLPQWVDKPQGRNFTLRDDRLDVVSDPISLPLAGGVLATGVLTWAREA